MNDGHAECYKFSAFSKTCTLKFEKRDLHPPSAKIGDRMTYQRISIGDRHFDIYDKIKTHCHRRFFEGSLNLDCSVPKKVLVRKEYEFIPWCAMQNITHLNILRPTHIDRSAISSSAFYITYDSDLLYNIDELAFAQKEYCVKRYNGVVFDLSSKLKELIWEIMRGLDHLHNQGVAHGNLKNEIYIISLSPPRAKIGGCIFNGNAMNFCQEARQDLYEVGCVLEGIAQKLGIAPENECFHLFETLKSHLHSKNSIMPKQFLEDEPSMWSLEAKIFYSQNFVEVKKSTSNYLTLSGPSIQIFWTAAVDEALLRYYEKKHPKRHSKYDRTIDSLIIFFRNLLTHHHTKKGLVGIIGPMIDGKDDAEMYMRKLFPRIFISLVSANPKNGQFHLKPKHIG